jgi:hypothetical protein
MVCAGAKQESEVYRSVNGLQIALAEKNLSELVFVFCSSLIADQNLSWELFFI